MKTHAIKLGKAYLQAKGVEPSLYHRTLYSWWINQEYNKVKRQLKIDRVKFQYIDIAEPYPSSKAMYEDYYMNGNLWISSANNNPVLCSPIDKLKFRLVHDYYHINLGAPFSLAGEFMIYREHCRDLKGLNKTLKNILRSEIVLQVCAFYANNKVNAIQKAVGV